MPQTLHMNACINARSGGPRGKYFAACRYDESTCLQAGLVSSCIAMRASRASCSLYSSPAAPEKSCTLEIANARSSPHDLRLTGDSIHLCELSCITKYVRTQHFRHARRRGWLAADFVSGYSSTVFLPERLPRGCCDLSSERSCHAVSRHDREFVSTEFDAVRSRSGTRCTGQRFHARFRGKRRCATRDLSLFDGMA